MTRKYLKERQQRNRELGKADAANRCAFCRRALPKHPFELEFADVGTGRYCNIDCRRDELDAQGQGA